MPGYIDRESVRIALCGESAITMKGVKILNQFPAADVAEVRHGEWWMQTDIADYPYGTCSVCGYVEWDAFPRGDTPNYCPNCGAKMDGKGEYNA